MKKCSSFLLVIISTLYLSGCAGVDRYIMQNDAIGATEYLEKNGQSYKTVAPKMQYWMCHGYAELRKFNDFYQCFEAYSQSVEDGEMTIASGDAFFGYQYTFNKDWTTADLNTLQAKVVFELGDYTRAKTLAKKAYHAITEGSPSCCLGMSATDGRGLLDEQILTRGILSISYWYLGNKAQSDIYLNELKDLPIGFREKSWQNDQKSWLAKAYFARDDYPAAYQVLVGEPFDTDVLGGINEIMKYEPITSAIDFMLSTDPNERSYLHKYEYQVMVCYSLAKLSSHEQSNSCYQELLQDPRIKRYGDLYYWSLRDLGANHQQLGNFTQSEQYLTQAIELLESQRSSIAFDSQKLGFTENNYQVYQNMVLTSIALSKPKQAFEYAERAKSRALIDMLASKKQFGQQENSSDIESITSLELNSLALTESDANTRKIRGLKRKLKNTTPKLASLVTVDSQTFETLTKPLKSDETLIEFFGEGKQGVGFVVQGESIQTFSLDFSNIDNKIHSFRKSLLDSDSNHHLKLSKQLHQQLIEPLLPALSTRNITIVPHGPLHYLPFNALHDGTDYFIDNYHLRTLPSASVLSYIEQPKSQRQSLDLLVVGNPDLGDKQLSLPAAEKEAIALAKASSNAKLLVNQGATESAFKTYSPNAKYLHIASHGQFDSDNPLNSRLLLASDDQNDGYLTVADIYDLDLNADLVTLSACETGLGDIKKGDDVIGLTRGFLYAGASSIVSSLWVVDDEATEKLMIDFYANIELKSKRDALRNAQLKIKDNYREHPFYWAAFQLTGAN